MTCSMVTIDCYSHSSCRVSLASGGDSERANLIHHALSYPKGDKTHHITRYSGRETVAGEWPEEFDKRASWGWDS
jgi:hypothetical protein